LNSLFDGQGIPAESDFLTRRPKSFLDRLKINGSLILSAPSMIAFFTKYNAKVTIPKLEEILPILSQSYSKIGAVGFCWGGKYSAWLGTTQKMACFAAAHPSGLDPSVDIKVDVPGLICTAKEDFLFPPKDRKAIQGKTKFVDIVEYDDVVHGFSIRGREDEEVVVKAREDVMRRFTQFFKKHLSS
jgi:dienelactone hydrolase